MESIYFVMAWACHRKCVHCYEERFRPYTRGALERVVAEAEANFPRIIANLPERMTYLDPDDPLPNGSPREKIGRIILSGGEALLDATRERVTYRVIDALRDKYADQGGVRIAVQTTGDLVTPAIIGELLARGVWMISVAGVDDFHVGIAGAEKQAEYKARLTGMFSAAGMRPSGHASPVRAWHEEAGPVFNFFGATEGTWIGKIWPRGRAWQNGLSTATMADNFCARWSGGLNFLNHPYAGSEVSIEPDGSVYPCCVKTARPLGSLLEEKLVDILDDLAGDPVFEAINAGKPERMGIAHGWPVERFLAASQTTTPKGTDYANLCIGCDAFHRDVLGPVLAAARTRRMDRAGIEV
ncbi:MAG: radical SAM/SPASM domain-containing protein [Alphaproteobacteria bacterium]|nr:radical SAM/SPASM domain-containing protein [Alphaproteobacteria bacterium]